MSHQLAGFAGFLAVVAVATPHLGSIVSPLAHADAATPVRVIDAVAPAGVAAPAASVLPRTAQAPALAYGISATSDLVSYGDAKTSDFDPEHPPADMGEAG